MFRFFVRVTLAPAATPWITYWVPSIVIVMSSAAVEQFVAVPLSSIGAPAQACGVHSNVNWTHGFGAQWVVQFCVAVGVEPQSLVPTAVAVCASPCSVQAPIVNVRVSETEAPAATPL